MQLIWFPKSEVFSIKSNLQQTFKLSLDLSFTKNGSDPAPFSHNAGAESWTEFKFGSEWKTLLTKNHISITQLATEKGIEKLFHMQFFNVGL